MSQSTTFKNVITAVLSRELEALNTKLEAMEDILEDGRPEHVTKERWKLIKREYKVLCKLYHVKEDQLDLLENEEHAENKAEASINTTPIQEPEQETSEDTYKEPEPEVLNDTELSELIALAMQFAKSLAENNKR